MKSMKWQPLLVMFGMLSLLAGCSGARPAPIQTPQTEEQSHTTSGQVISATGRVIPATWAALSFPISGQVVDLLVEEGTDVEESDVLARLDATDLELAVTRAEAELAVAEANLDLAKSGPREAEIERAENQLAAANARVSLAVAQRNKLKEPPDADLVISAQSELEQAQQTQQGLQQAYDDLIRWAEINMPTWDYQQGTPTPMDNETNLRHQLELANLRLAATQAELEHLLAGPTPDQLRVADARVWSAAAQADAAKAYLELVKAGVSPQDVAISEAQVDQARVAVESAKAARDQAVLIAPFDGTISTLDMELGELVGSGAPVLILADMSTLQIETTDLNELDIARIKVGSPATITFDALSDVTLEGEVLSIAPKSAEGAGVNYAVTITLGELPSALRWGMTAFIDIRAE